MLTLSSVTAYFGACVAPAVIPQTIAGAALGCVVVLLAYVLSLRDEVAKLSRVSMLDPLTGLTRGYFFDAIRWPALLRSDKPLAALYVDLDGLKPTNDSKGHAAGDRIIEAAARVIQASVRRGIDDVVRLHAAGDEFLVVASVSSNTVAERIATEVLEALRRAKLSASIGVAFTASRSYTERAALREHAEGAMRSAKQRGRGCVVVADEPAGGPVSDGVPEPSDAEQTARYEVGQPQELAAKCVEGRA